MPHFPAPYRLPLTSDDPNEVMRRAITYAFAIAPLYRRADGGAVEGYAGGGDVSAPITGPHTITASDLIGTAAPSGQTYGAYTDAGGQKIAAPFVSSMSGGYPVYNTQPTTTPSKPSSGFDLQSLMQRIFGQRFGYGFGGDVEGEVDFAPGHTQLPDMTVGHPHVEEALRHIRLPEMTVGHARPNYDRGETMKAYEPTSWERAAQWMMGHKAPSPERRQFVEGLMGTSGLGDEKTSLPNAAHMVASFYPPTMGAAATLSAVELAEKIANGGKLEASDILSLVPTGAAALASGAAGVFGGEHHHDAAHDVLSRMRQHKGGGGSLVKHGMPENAIRFYNPRDEDSRYREIYNFGDEFFSEGGEVDGYKKGGAALIETLKLARGYKDPASKYIADWKWRPLRDVQRDVGVSEVPEHVQNFGRFMSDISDKAGTEGLDPEDLIKAYMITRSSIQREGRTPAKLASYGIPVRDPSADLVRPEGQMADFLASSDGVRFLNEARKGDLSQDVVDAAMRVMKPFGMAKAEPDAMDWARRNLVEQTPLVSDMVARARAGASDPSEWRAFTEGVRGVGPAKSGFLASLLGRGDMPTLDARQAILHTGLKNAEVQGIMGMKGGKVGHEAVDRLAARQRAMNLQLPEQLDPFYQHLAHHTVWDAVGNEQTTHQDIIDAMKPRADGGEVNADPGVVDRALSFLSQFNPVGTAEAAPRPLVKAIMSAADKARQIASAPKFDREAFHAAVKQADADAIAAPSIVTTGRDVLAKNPNIDPNISLSTAGVPFAEHSYEWSPTGLLLPKRESDLAGLVRDRALITPALGDISPAETVIKNVGDLQLPEPTFTHGGGPYQRSRHAMGPNPAAWASRDAEANKMYNKILENAQAEGRADPRFKDSPIIMSHTTMGYPSVDSTHIVRHNILGQIDALQQAGKIDPNEVERFDAFMRKKLGDKWPGMLNTDAVEQYLASNGSATSVFVQGLDNKGRLRAGFPDVGAARFAAMHPKLIGADPMASGYSMAVLDPSKGTTGVWHGPSAETVHPTYGTRIPSLGYIGGTKYQVPFELMFPDWASRQKSHYFEKKSGTLKPMTPTMLQQSMMTQKPVQRATQEWLDNIMEHVEKEKKPWGWKRGGRTRIHF